MSLFNELKRRNVIKVALLYTVAAWLILQVADVLFEQLGLPGWAFRFIFGLLVICFPLVLLFSWVFEITPEGIKRESQIAAEASITMHTGQRINKAITVLLVLAILTVVADRLIPERQPDPVQVAQVNETVPVIPLQPAVEVAASDKSIAVLPFVNMSGDEENEYFSDGLTEELLNSLARIQDLKVAGRTSSFAFKGQNQDLREIAQQLDVANLLEGSVRKAGNKVRITAQLVKASDGYHLWSDTFDRELDDIFEIQEEIAEMVAGALQATLLGIETGSLVQAQTDKPEAWEAYLRGRYVFRLAPDSEDNRKRAEAEYLHALNVDPGFTLAKWGLFQVLDFRQRNGAIDYEEGQEAMTRLATEMFAEDAELAESHLALGRAAVSDFRIREALEAYKKAVALNPGNVDALTSLGGTYANMRQDEQALELRERALSLDPLAIPALVSVASSYARAGRCEDLDRIQQRTLTIAPQAGRIRGLMGVCLMMNGGDMDRAIALFEQEPVGFLHRTLLAIAWHRQGDFDKANAELEFLDTEYGEAAATQFGQIYAQWGQPDKAVEWLNKAFDTSDPGMIGLYTGYLLEPLEDDPGFQALLAKWKQRAGLL